MMEMHDIHGHWAAKRALEIAAAGGHSLLIVGPADSGKSLLLRAAERLLPEGVARTEWREARTADDADMEAFDLVIAIEPVADIDMESPPPAEPAEEIAARVAVIHALRSEEAGGRLHADEGAEWLLERAVERMGLSESRVERVCWIAETLAWMETNGPIGGANTASVRRTGYQRRHVAEALVYTPLPGAPEAAAKKDVASYPAP